MEAFGGGFELYGRFPEGIESLAWHESEIRKGHYFRIESDGDLAGGMCLAPPDGEMMDLKYVFVSNEFRNKGIGSRAMGLIEGRYGRVRQLRLFTPYKSCGNHHFYEKLGYVKTGEFRPFPGDPFTAFVYTKRINE